MHYLRGELNGTSPVVWTSDAATRFPSYGVTPPITFDSPCQAGAEMTACKRTVPAVSERESNTGLAGTRSALITWQLLRLQHPRT